MKLSFVNTKILIAITGEYTINIINKIKNAGVCIQKMNWIDDKLTCVISLNDYEIVSKILEKNNSPMEIIKYYGPYNKLKNIKNIRSYIAGLIIFGIILYIVSLYLWNIQFEGNFTITNNQLENFLEEKGVVKGIFKSKIDCNLLESDIRNNFFDVTWVCAEIKGTNLIIHIKENYNKEIAVKEDTPYNLVAKHNSVIKSIVTRQGVPVVKSGDIVKEGDLLISGAIEISNEFDEKLFTEYVNADGDIYGETILYYEDSFSMKYKDKIEYKSSIEKPYIEIFGKTIGANLSKKGKYYIVDDAKNIKLFDNFFIPIEFGVKKQFFYNEVDKEYTKQQAIDISEHKLSIFLLGLEEKGVQILEKNVNIDVGKNICKSEGTITVLEPLAKVSPINYIEEGTTALNERN